MGTTSLLTAGRAGALALALGIGGAIAVTGLADADADAVDSRNNAAGHAGPARTSSVRSAAMPNRRPAPATASPTAASALKIRDRAQAPQVRAQAQAVSPTDFWLFGDGTADHPNAGILAGNGYSYTRFEGACVAGSACNGGNSGLLGDSDQTGLKLVYGLMVVLALSGGVVAFRRQRPWS